MYNSQMSRFKIWKDFNLVLKTIYPSTFGDAQLASLSPCSKKVLHSNSSLVSFYMNFAYSPQVRIAWREWAICISLNCPWMLVWGGCLCLLFVSLCCSVKYWLCASYSITATDRHQPLARISGDRQKMDVSFTLCLYFTV